MWDRIRNKGKKVNPFKKSSDHFTQSGDGAVAVKQHQKASTQDADLVRRFQALSNPSGPTISDAQASSAASPKQDVAAPTSSSPTVVTLAKSGCTVCQDLDPHRGSKATDGLTEDSWASKEYDIPLNTPAGVIEVKDAKEILNSAKTGCMYCMILSAALNAIHPGWHTEDVFLNVYVASGLPVVVRLSFGKTVSVPAGKEQLERSGVVLPPGQNMTFVATIVDPSKPAVEIELYRREEETMGKRVTVAPLTDRIGYAYDRQSHAANEPCFTFIKNHLKICSLSGHACVDQDSAPLLPDRVIWLRAPTLDGMQLVEPKGMRAKYLTLSYCWGPDKNPFLTNMATLGSRMAGIGFDDLPLLFQDVVTISRRLGIDYLWIDRLCIIQGSDGDFKVQAPKMGQIYGNSTLTIVAASVESENDGILTSRDTQWQSHSLKIELEGITSLEICFRRRSIPLGIEHQGGDYGKVSSRAWIWQERLLSSRSVFYTPSALKFECRCMSSWEGDHPSQVRHSWSAQLYAEMDDDRRLLRWTALVEEFTKRQITYATDRLPAIGAVMQRLGNKSAWTAVNGMWKEKLLETLRWGAEETFKWNVDVLKSSDAGPLPRADAATYRWPSPMPTDYAPTWSWASINGQITYRHFQAKSGALHDADPFKYTMEILKLDQDQLTVRGYFVTAALRMRKKTTPSGALATIYEVGSEEYGQWFKLDADAPLEPFTAILPGDKTMLSTRRTAFGESPPTEEWTSQCFCLMIGKSLLRCETVIVGISPRSIYYVERLGILFGMEPDQYVDPRPSQFVLV